jgi:hypothetical protein
VEAEKSINIAMAIKNILIFVFLIFVLENIWGQNQKVFEAPEVKKVMDHFNSVFKNKTHIEGWRVQIVSTTDRSTMENMRSTAGQLYPNLPLKWEHTRPYFKIQLGAFQTKLQATEALYIIKKDYPTAYLVMDNKIEPREIFEYSFP